MAYNGLHGLDWSGVAEVEVLFFDTHLYGNRELDNVIISFVVEAQSFGQAVLSILRHAQGSSFLCHGEKAIGQQVIHMFRSC